MDDLADFTAHDQGGDPVPPPAPTAVVEPPTPEDAAVSAGGMKNIFGTTKAGQMTFAENVYNLLENPADTRNFSVHMASDIYLNEEKELMRLVMIDSSFAEKMIEHLEREHVLLVTGDRRTGKSTIAKYLATRIAETHDLKQNTYVVEPLERSVRIIPRKLAEDRERFGGRVTIFAEALGKQNRDLMNFFTADRSTRQQLTNALKASHAYLIFTAAAVNLDPIRSQLSIDAHLVPALPRELVSTGIDRKLVWLQTSAAARATRISILHENRDRMQQELKTLPNIANFIDDFVKIDLDLDVALARWSAPSDCFLDDLASDVDAWCFTLTLALTEATPNGEPVSWCDFEILRREITEIIKTDSEIFPRRRFRPDQESDEGPERTTGAALADDALLTRCRVKVAKDRGGLRDIISFGDSECGAAIWESVLLHNRRVLMKIVPVLRAIAENRKKTANLSLRVLAAQMIGRIGAIDPKAIALPLIEREWTGSDDDILRALVGYLLQGVLATGNKRYRDTALSALEELADVDPQQVDDENLNHLLTAIVAYSQLGDYGPAKAIEHLGDIAIEHCAPFMAEIHVLFMMAEKAERDRSRTSYRRAEALRARGRGLGRRAYRMLANEAPKLAALEQALVYLCIANEPVETLASTRDWVSRGGQSTAMLLTTLFLREQGIADRLEAFGAEVDGFPNVRITPLVLSAASSRENVRDLCGFLADIQGSISSAFSLPLEVQRGLKERFAACLIMWARGAVTVPPYRDAVEDLFVTLAMARAGALHAEMYALLGEASFAESAAMSAFAASVRKRI
jgi:hypothetical protein